MNLSAGGQKVQVELVEHHYDDAISPLLVITLRCRFLSTASHTRIPQRVTSILVEANTHMAGAVENPLLRRNQDGSKNSEQGLEDYRAAVRSFLDSHVIPALASLPQDQLRFAPYIPTFVAYSTDEGIVQLSPGLPSALDTSIAEWMQRLQPLSSFALSTDTPVYDIEHTLVLDIFDTGSRDVFFTRLPDGSHVVTQCIPSLQMVTSPDLRVLAEGILRELAVLSTMPPHPNVIGPPVAYITRQHNGQTLLCGFATRFCSGGCLRDALHPNPEGVRSAVLVALARRVKWAYQMCAALQHVHHVAHTYHGDIKLDNVVLDEHDNAVLIDFEQGRANDEAGAPEVRAGCTASVVPPESGDGPGALVYRYPESETEVGTLWDREFVYDAWKGVPRAVEAAEVYTLAVALAGMFGQGEVRDGMLGRCREVDPNVRPTFAELGLFFHGWYEGLCGGDTYQ